MNTYKITFDNNNTITTGFNGTWEEAAQYYIGRSFQFGDTEEHPTDLMAKAIKVEVIK